MAFEEDTTAVKCDVLMSPWLEYATDIHSRELIVKDLIFARNLYLTEIQGLHISKPLYKSGFT